MSVYLVALVNASLELVPEELWSGKQVMSSARKRGKKPGEILLDVSVHGWDMSHLPDRESRGRPDIIHQCLLDAMDSPAYLSGLSDVLVELRGDSGLMHFKRGVRLPRNYDQFKGLMEQVLLNGRAPLKGEPLIWLERKPLKQFLDELGYPLRVMEVGGEPMSLSNFPEGNTAFLVGAFQSGAMPADLVRLGPVFSLYGSPLTANAVVSTISCMAYLKHLQSLSRGAVLILSSFASSRTGDAFKFLKNLSYGRRRRPRDPPKIFWVTRFCVENNHCVYWALLHVDLGAQPYATGVRGCLLHKRGTGLFSVLFRRDTVLVFEGSGRAQGRGIRVLAFESFSVFALYLGVLGAGRYVFG